MYVIHTRLTKVAKLASLVITVFTELGKSRSVTSLTHAHNWGVSKLLHVRLSLKNVFHERHPQLTVRTHVRRSDENNYIKF